VVTNKDTPTRYIIHENEVVFASTPTELVAKLAATSFNPVSPEEFKTRAAVWVRELFNYDIPTDSDEMFVLGMLSAGFYRIDKNPK
jgi:hypothetical protein